MSLNSGHDPSISIIISALNEEAVVGRVLAEIQAVTKDYFQTFEIIAINDGSYDATGNIIDSFVNGSPNSVAVHNQVNLGLCDCFKLGVSSARYDHVMLLCGDGGLPAKSLPQIFKRVGEADLVIPYITNLKKIKSPTRYILSRSYVKLLNYLFGFRLNYYNGLPVYKRLLLNELNITSTGFGFQAEILIKLLKSKCTYVHVGVEGAEETGKSDALRFKNIISVANTFTNLCWELLYFKPVSKEAILRARNFKYNNMVDRTDNL